MEYCSSIIKHREKTICLVLFMCISTALSAQKKITGIYRTMNDYLNKQLSYSTDNGQASKIKLYTLAPKSYVTIRSAGTSTHIYKKDIFAYQLTSGEIYRIEGNNSYQILNNNPKLLLYKRKKPTAPKDGPADQFKYYFSASNGAMQALTTWNIKQAFADTHASLPDQVDALFKRDTELLHYDSFHRMYKLEWLLQ